MPQRPRPIVCHSHIVQLFCMAFLFWFTLAPGPAYGRACPADTNGNSIVNVDDLLAVINAWGACPQPCPPSCAADIAPSSGAGGGGGNCVVNADDLLAVINGWGPCPLLCPPPLIHCGICVDPMNDSQNCGGCFIVCPPDHYCSGGTCVPSRPPPPDSGGD